MKTIHILGLVLIWQMLFVLSTAAAMSFLPEQKTFLGAGSRTYATNPWLYSRGNFDGLHYVYIATRGYGYAEQAFFPLYPNFIRFMDRYVHETYLSGVLISLVSITVALIFLAKLLQLDYTKKKVFWMILSLLIFPTSFYFGTVYTESLFFLFVITAFYNARKGNWLLAGILGALAANTRFIGIFLFPALVVEWWSRPQKNIFKLGYLLLIPVGLLAYMAYLQIHNGDPLAFIHALPSFGSYRSTAIVMLYQVFWRYLRMILTLPRGTLLYSSVIYEAAAGLLFLVLTVVAFLKLRLSYAVFMAAAYLTPTLTGSFVSLPRYVLVCFPGFILLGGILDKHPVVRNLYLLVCFVTFILLASLFTRGYWVA